MSLTLAVTWNPRGEIPRFRTLLSQLEQTYVALVMSLPPVASPEAVESIEELAAQYSILHIVRNREWSWGRYMALKAALEFPATHIQYADMDRLLRWVETRPVEWRYACAAIQQSDYMIFGRTAAAYATHPQALIQTEAISNRVASELVGKKMDVSAGSKGFSRQVVEFLMANAKPGRALGTDAEWTVLVHRGGFSINYVEVAGLDWESADRYLEHAAEPETQRLAAEAYDADPQHWARRVETAMEIVEAGLEAAHREINNGASKSITT